MALVADIHGAIRSPPPPKPTPVVHWAAGSTPNIQIIQGATRIPPSWCGIAFGYGSCICHRCDLIFVFCGLFGVLCNVPAD